MEEVAILLADGVDMAAVGSIVEDTEVAMIRPGEAIVVVIEVGRGAMRRIEVRFSLVRPQNEMYLTPVTVIRVHTDVKA